MLKRKEGQDNQDLKYERGLLTVIKTLKGSVK